MNSIPLARRYCKVRPIPCWSRLANHCDLLAAGRIASAESADESNDPLLEGGRIQ
jgi:hypothetical protein